MIKNLHLILILSFFTLHIQAQIFVKYNAIGTGDGTSWSNAYTDLQLAINNATTGDEIWVAEGIYKPNAYPAGCSNCSSTRDYSFLLKDGVAIYGGFSGTEILLSERNWESYPTILSGDIDGTSDEITGSGVTLSITGNAGNVYHVVLALNNEASTVLDGFIITGGNADSIINIGVNGQNIPRNIGGGMYSTASYAIVRNTTFIGNNSKNKGGAIFNDTSYISLLDIIVSKNNATNAGGGIYNAGSLPEMRDMTLSDNRADIGAGVFNFFSSPVMIDMIFTGNYADFYGGGIYNSSSSPIMTDMEFANNTADTGGGIANFLASYPIMTNITIRDNYGGLGGGMYNYDNASPIMNNVTIIDNYAEFYGGGIYNFSSSPIMTNVVVVDNYADFDGGGIYNHTSSIVISNSTIVNNETLGNGGGIYNKLSSFPVLSNCIVWANTAGTSTGIHNLDTSIPMVTYSIIEGADVHPGVGNMNIDPLFMNMANPIGLDGIHRTPDDGLSLSLCSPAIDMGKNDSIPDGITTDIASEARIYADTVDMGAYEPIWLVTFDAVPNKESQMSVATVERRDISGWTHYLDGNNNCEWLLSINKGVENIGKVGDGTFELSHQTNANYGLGTGLDLSVADYVADGTWYVMNRLWNVNVTQQPSSDLAIRFPYHNNDFNDLSGSFPLTTHDEISFYKVDNVSDPHSLEINASDYHHYINGNAASLTTWLYGNPNPGIHYAEYLVSSFSGGSGGVGTIGVLPVELLYFYVMKDDQSAVLRWGTASEENNAGFHIEHSLDGISFERIAWVDGNGDSQEEESYDFTHLIPLDGNNYYRLVQEDFDGIQEYSKIEVLNFDKKIDINVYPNLIPQTQNTFIKFNLGRETQVTAEVYNYSGQLVKVSEYLMTEGNNLVKLEVSNLPSDIYWVNLLWGKRIKSFRLTIQE